MKKKIEEIKMVAAAFQIPIPISEAKRDFSRLYKQAEAGREIIMTIKKSGLSNVSLINSGILDVIIEEMAIPIEETPDERLGGLTIAIPYLPMYGEGEIREEAIENLINAVVEFCEVYIKKLELYKRSESAYNQAIMLKLLRCNNNRKAIRAALKI